MPYYRARVRSNEVGRDNAEEGGREGLPKMGKNDEGFEKMVKERSRGLDAVQLKTVQTFERRNGGEERGEASQSSPANAEFLEDVNENKGKISRFS